MVTQETCWAGRCTGSSVRKSDQVWADAFIWSGGWVPGQKLPWVSHICLDLINMMQALNFNKPVVLVYSVDGNLSLCKFVWVFFFLF